MKTLVMTGLAVLAAVQLLELGERWSPGRDMTSMEVGAKIPVSAVDTAHPITVALAFRETCIHCVRVAGEWSHLMRRWDGRVGLAAVTSDSMAVGRDFAEKHGWIAPVFSFYGMEPLSVEARLVARTPWIWILGQDSVLHYQGHGADLASVERALGRLVAEGG